MDTSQNIDDSIFEDVLDNLPGGAFTYSAEPDGRFFYISKSMLEMLGYSEDEFRAKFENCFQMMVYKEDRERTLREIDDQMKKSSYDTVEYRIEKKDGSLVWVFDAGHRVGEEGHRVFYVTLADETRQRATVEEIASQNKRSRILAESMDVVLFSYEAGTDEVSFDIYRTGGKPKKIVRKHFAKHLQDKAKVSKETQEKVLEVLERASRIPESGTFDCEHDLFGQKPTWGRVHYVSVLDSDGTVSSIVGRIDDITEEKESERRYLEEQKYLETLSGGMLSSLRVNLTTGIVESATGNDVLFRLDDRGMAQYDSVFEDMCSRVDVKSSHEFFNTFSRKALLRAFEDGEDSLSMEYRIKRGNGRPLWVRCDVRIFHRPLTDELLAFMHCTDIEASKTMRVVADKYLVKQFDFIFSINGEFDSYLGVLISDVCVDEFTGYPEGYAVAMHDYIEDHVTQSDKAGVLEFTKLDNVFKALSDNVPCVHTFSMTDSQGRLRYKQLEFIDLDLSNKTVAMVRTDITAMHEEQMAQAETLRTALAAAQQASVAKSEFLSHMSHEIRTPMNAIIGLTTIMLQRNDLDSDIENALSKIGLSSRYLLSLINDILDMSRIESGQMVLSNDEFGFENFVTAINTIIYPQCQSAGLDYDCIVRGFTEETYVGDATKLQQVLVNLLGNAVKFTPAGGKVHLVIEQIAHDNNTARLRFIVSDTGVGISEEFLPNLFESFSQEENGRTSVYGGSGLGLAITKHIVTLMDGTIDVHSIKNVGTEFTVEVSLGSARVARNRAALRSAFNLEALRTLIVDDDVIVCEHSKIVLEEVGVTAEWVCSGMEAVDLVKQRRASEDDYDLILLDWKMPDMDGIETAREIRKVVGPEVTIIIMTAYDWSAIEDRARKAGVDTFINKPLFASSVMNLFENIFSRKASAKPKLEAGSGYDFSGRRVLLVEDNVINIEVARIMLEEKGFEVDVAENGIEAIEAFTTTEPGHYDAILMDIRMPVMDGLTATSQIRRFKKADAKTIPIIAMTADAFDADVDRSLESGMNAHLSKPIEPEVLYEMLARYVEQAPKETTGQ